MKKGVVQSSIVVGIIVLFVGAGVLPSTIGTTKEKTVITKMDSRGYIQGLIDNASNGDIIYVPSGMYYENIIINKSISLIGEDKNTTVIDGSGYKDVVAIVSDWVNVSGFTIKNGTGTPWFVSGIGIDTFHNTISGNIITTNGYGITTGYNNTITGNIITNNVAGIRIVGKNTLCNNTITNNFYGIVIFENGDNNTISNNSITNNTFGMYLNSCDHIISNNSFYNSGLYFNINIENITNTIVTNNTVNGKPLIYLYNTSDLVINTDAGQIILILCTNITVQNQDLSNATVGIQILESNNCVISGNTIGGNYEGIFLNGLDNIIHNNTVTKNQCSIGLRGDNNTISDNTILGSNIYGNTGISVHGWNNFINDNTIANSYYGISMWDNSNYNSIINNNIINNSNRGIVLHEDCCNNAIINNTIVYSYWGILVDYDSDYNNIINNTISNNEVGVKVCYSWNQHGGDHTNIINNIITNNSYSIDTEDCDYINIINNTIINNNYGIRANCDYANIIDNFIANNDYALDLPASYENIISNNTIMNNNYGVRLTGNSQLNIIYHNNLKNNKQNAYDCSSMNTWYNAELQEGNYWSDYIGNDLNGDGIGDTPYNIPEGSEQDRHPFMEPDGWLKKPDFQNAFIFGKITNLSSIGGYITFEAVKTRVIIFQPFSFHKYISGEECFVLKVYRGLIDVRYVFALCRIEIRV